MEIVCQQCQSKFRIDDEKLPAGKTVGLKCPKCQTKLTITRPEKKEAVSVDDFDDLFAFDEGDAEDYDATEKPFDFIEEEGKTAMICEADPLIREKVKPTLDMLEYHVTEVQNSRDALKKMRYINYDVIIINEYFDTKDPDANSVLIYLERMGMQLRRNMFVTLLSSRFRTMDNMAAFQKSVNMIVNMSNLDDFGKIFQRGMADYGIFYRIYKDTLQE